MEIRCLKMNGQSHMRLFTHSKFKTDVTHSDVQKQFTLEGGYEGVRQVLV